jgi:parallel beta-helix repeat protein
VSLQVKSTTTLKLDAAAEIKLAPTSAGWYRIVHVPNATNVRIEGGTITGDRDTHTGTDGDQGAGISIWNSQNVVISGVKVAKAWGDGIFIDGYAGGVPDGVRVENCTIDGNRRLGVGVSSGRNIVVTGSTISNTQGAAPAAGIELAAYDATQVIEYVTVSGNTFRANDAGIAAEGVTSAVRYLTVTGNLIESNRSHGIWLDLVNDAVVTGNTVRNNSGWGIDLLGSARAKLDSNTVTGNVAGGVQLTRALNGTATSNSNTINKNTINDNKGYGVALVSGSSYNKITSNTILRNTKKAIYISSDSRYNTRSGNKTK